MLAKEEIKNVDGLSGFVSAVAVGRRSLLKKPYDTTCRLGDVLGRVLAPLIASQKKTLLIEDLWAEVVPSHVAAHCRIMGMHAGQLDVSVDSPVYAYELRMCSPDVVKHIQQRCPRLGLRKIKVTVNMVPALPG